MVTTVGIVGFDWDGGNWPKCGKHGVSREEIEQVLLGSPAVLADPSTDEPRMRGIGKTLAGRYVFLVFMLRRSAGQIRLRPISARYMHQKEIDHYERQT
ncbi:MAG: BrnT family toxin [Rhodocyclaceae bacterium]|nr:BrnT family toxin [Rhodocyclaceae bacterium]